MEQTLFDCLLSCFYRTFYSFFGVFIRDLLCIDKKNWVVLKIFSESLKDFANSWTGRKCIYEYISAERVMWLVKKFSQNADFVADHRKLLS